MTVTIDNIELDETNIEFNYASEFVKHTDKIIYLTGKAGTGKTTFLKYLRETTLKKTVILAPTGVAAINAGGQTIHSFFKIQPSVYVPNDARLRTTKDKNDKESRTIYENFQYNKEKLQIIRSLELLIIDEISMVRCDLLDVIDRLLRVFRRRQNEPFGGVQVILIGDTFQLPPIADFAQWNILKGFYSSPFFFSSKVIEQSKPVYIELKKIYRQNEQEFIDLLNKVRINQINQNDLNLLNSKYNPTFSPNGNSNYIILATHNNIVDTINLSKLSELPSEPKLFEAKITGTFPDNIIPTNKTLQLKENAQIMFIKNDKNKRYFNGKIGKINSIDDNDIVIEFSDGSEISVEKQEWHNIKFTWNEKENKIVEEIIGTFIQFPLKLAWAITVHKSQGLTFEKVIADLGSAFASGQVYVALSRCTTFSGLVLKSKIEQKAIKTDPKVLEFARNETPNTLIIQELNSGKADFYYRKVREAIKSLNFIDCYENLVKAFKFRNEFETENFKNYFIKHASKLGSYKLKYINLLSDNYKLKEENHELGCAVDGFEEAGSIFTKKISEQNKEIEILLDKTKELEKINLQQKNKISRYLSDKDKAEKTIENYSIAIEQNEKQISKLEKKIKMQELEIKRLKNLKWYQKIIGRE